LVPLTSSAAKDHHLLELRLYRTVDAQIGEMACQPAYEFLIERVERDDEDQHTTVLQQR